MGPGRTNSIATIVASACLVACALFASGCGSSADTASAEGAPKLRGGTITIGFDQEPQCLNSLIQCGSMAATSTIMDSVFDALLKVDAEGNFIPAMATDVPTRENGQVVETKAGGMDVTMHLNPKAAWSDGKPVTCEDVQFGFETRMDDRWSITSRKGWDLVDAVDCPDPTTVVYRFKEPYAPYLGLVGAAPLPKHVLDGKDFNTFFNDRIPIASGPFQFERWQRSVDITLKRNERYWDQGEDDKPWLERLRFVFLADANTLKIQLRTGEVDMISPPPDSTLQEELEAFPRSTSETEPDVYWEQIAFNNAKAPTNDVNVRNAIARSIDRNQIAEVVLKGQVKVLDSTLLEAKKEYYIPAWGDVKNDPKAAAALLEKSGYERQGQYYEKGGKPLTVLFKSTAGNPLRLKVAQLLQQRLKKNGIKMDIALEPPAVFFGQSTVQGAYNMGLWAWSSGVDPSQISMFACDQIPSEANEYSGQNNYRYCNERVSELLAKSDVTTSVDERAAMVHEIQTLMAKDMPLLPLFQRPATLAYTKKLQGIDLNPLGGLTWNVADWAVTQQ